MIVTPWVLKIGANTATSVGYFETVQLGRLL